jgi:hypothetical protein
MKCQYPNPLFNFKLSNEACDSHSMCEVGASFARPVASLESREPEARRCGFLNMDDLSIEEKANKRRRFAQRCNSGIDYVQSTLAYMRVCLILGLQLGSPVMLRIVNI